MKVDDLISVMEDSETIIIKQYLSKIEYFKAAVKVIPECLKDREIVCPIQKKICMLKWNNTGGN